MQEIYGNTATAVNRDIIWPSFASVYEKESSRTDLYAGAEAGLQHATTKPDGEYAELLCETD
ncbi:MAG: hypothetical protein ACLVB0_01465 [Fusicatenibacter saccharivorans]